MTMPLCPEPPMGEADGLDPSTARMMLEARMRDYEHVYVASGADDRRFPTAIDLASAAGFDDLDDDFAVIDGVHNAIVADQ